MHGNRCASLRATCPCYKCNENHVIYCLGIEGSASTLRTFSSPADRKCFMKEHCIPEARSARCILYSILFKENQDDDG